MTRFEFILVPLGMLAAFAVAELMGSWARAIRAWDATQKKFLYLSFSLFLVLNLLFGHLNGLWAYRFLDFTSLVTFVVLLPTLLASFAMLVLGAPATDVEELDSHYFKYAPKAGAITLAHLIVSTLSDFLPGLTFAPGILLPLSVQAGALLCMIVSNSRTMHIGAHVALWLTWTFFLVVNHVYA